MGTTLFTIGFAGRSAASFFGTLSEAGVGRVLDIRRWNTSQLAGYTKRRDLPYFLEVICGATYEHRPDLAPAADLLKAWQGDEIDYEGFRSGYLDGLEDVDLAALAADLAGTRTALLCSEADPAQCHRRMLAERLVDEQPDLEVVDL